MSQHKHLKKISDGCCSHTHSGEQCNDNHHQQECCSEKSCDEESCCHHDDESSCHEDFAHELLHVADEAWMELLKEKIKEKILSCNGTHLDQLACLVAETNNKRWKHKLGINKVAKEFKHKLDNIMNCCDESCDDSCETDSCKK